MTCRIIHTSRLMLLVLTLAASQQIVCAESNLGTPFITNYTNDEYRAGAQTWDVRQVENGILYFANNDGLLEFDGTSWRTYEVANRTIVRSLAIGEDNKIYVGAQGEFGYFETNKAGDLVYHSLLPSIPEAHREFDDVWHTDFFDGTIFFQSAGKIYTFKNNSFKVHEFGGAVDYLTICNQQLYVADNKAGLHVFMDGEFQLLPGSSLATNFKITSILATAENQLLITTLKNGVYQYSDEALEPWNIPVNDFLKKNRIYSGVTLPDNSIALGTSLNGILVLDETGRPTYHFSKKNGLQNNNILSLQTDDNGNVWAGLNKGIDYVEMSSPYSTIYPDGDLEGTTYAARIFDEKIYLGTSSGLYVADWTSYYDPFKTKRFELVSGAAGQIWGLTEYDGLLLAGHHEGAFLIDGRKAKKLSDIQGAWTFLGLDQHPGYLVGGTYSGLTLYRKTDEGLEFVRKLEGFTESSRIMALDNDGHIWVTHPYRGAFKISLSPELDRIAAVKFYNSEHGFPSDLHIHVFKVGEELFFTAEQNVYRYSKQADRFEIVDSYQSVFGQNASVKRLIPDEEGNVWYASDEKVGLLEVRRIGLENEIKNYEFPKLFNQLVRGFEHIYPYGKNDVFFGTEKGFIYFHQEKNVETSLPKVLIRSVELLPPIDSILYSGHPNITNEKSKVRLQHKLNALYFSYSAPDFRNVIEYSYQLEGLDDSWSNWSTKTEKEYTNLSAGDYKFTVRARHPNQAPGAAASYVFSISSPWYRTKLAYFCYSLLALFLGYRWISKTQQNFEKEKELMRSRQEELMQQKDRKHRLVVEQSEKEIIELKNDKLETEINHQNQELASLTMHFVQKNGMLLKLKEELNALFDNTEESDTRKNIKRLIRFLDSDAQMDEDWPRFAYYFDRVHSDFTKKLLTIHPALTQKDLKLCVFLRMNLSTKEIAPLLNISIRGVEISRYRLRKKLNIESKVRLADYLFGI